MSSGPSRPGLPFVLAAPSGTGKTTVCHEVLRRDANLRFSVSHTTRAPREGERNGVDYHYVRSEDFRRMVEEGAFLEHAEYAGQLYGTSWQALRAPLAAGLDLLLEIEVQGARQVRERLPEARLVFLLPPSMRALEDRLRKRATDSEDAIQRRLAAAHQELEAVHVFDYAVVNDELEQAVDGVLAIVKAERRGEAATLRERFGRAQVWERWRSAQARS